MDNLFGTDSAGCNCLSLLAQHKYPIIAAGINSINPVKLSQIDLLFIYMIFSTMTEHFEKQTERIKKRNDEDYDEV